MCARMQRLDRAPGIVRDAADLLSAVVPPAVAARSTFAGAVNRRLQSFSRSRADRYAVPLMYFHHTDKIASYGPALRPYLVEPTTGLLESYLDDASDLVTGAARADIHTYLPDDILTKLDVATMAHGLEARAPFLDVELMELAARIPSSVKMRGGRLKGLLKDALQPIVPAAVLSRPKKGFGVPIDKWFAEELHDFCFETLTSNRAFDRGLFKKGYAEKLLKEHRSGFRRHHLRLFTLLMLELWQRAWIDGDSASASR
jgi:asparagine synthase (glutamine-hydrolysing)